ncbi:heme lyase CcmF/NrfE family subunit [Ferruginivarius sediminum]|uniref:Heme lyase CcmF/NrfE family subunit n=1 Tax=Ferruginivarius sediminum TaxID=2661937 RepID=A0A369T8Q7_9PROT|nr:heme lyase CcmF/NrfE family subunit [Ferruginivarius sediminum]RDD60557.1 heme lyase CcmF/NrfE family subunit [Ferruginivarius sediminum]
MIVELGHFALVLALFTALIQAVLPMWGAQRRIPGFMALATPASVVQLALIAVAFLALMHAYVTSDFTVLNVVQNSHSLKPMLYKISGVWGNHEGSLVLWVLILALFGAIVAVFGRNLPPTLKARTLSVQALIAVGFLLFMLFTSNPFERVFPPPANGQDLNPLLQDPGLAFHPPMLYTGYVGFSIVFSFAVAALIEGRVDAAWARWVRPWTLLAWVFLTLGIALGSWWAYYELGWGGWWYWDPVENASFMPWLVGTALLHSAIVVEKRDALKTWTILLAILAFSLSLIGTFLVRSGVLTSVHAFATDPDRGVFILGLLIVAIGGSLLLYAWRAPTLKGGGLFAPISREGALVLNNLLLSAAAATVLIGTLYPLFLEALGGGKVSVGPPYFNATFIPLMLPMIAALGVGPLLAWKRADLKGALSRLKLAFVVTAVVFAVMGYLLWGRSIFGVLGMALAAWLATAVAIEFAERCGVGKRGGPATWLKRARGMPRAAWGMTLAHFGLAVCMVGMTGSALWQSEEIRVMRPGETAQVGGYSYTFEGAEQVEGPNYTATRGHFTVTSGGDLIANLDPERRRYVVSGRETTEAAIVTRPLGDLFAVIGEQQSGQAFTVRLYFKPVVSWIWSGALLMAIGGLFSLSDRRLRVGAPTRRGAPRGGVAQPSFGAARRED